MKKSWTEERIDRRVWKRLSGNPFADYDPADGIALWSLWEMPSFSVGTLVRRGPSRPWSKPTSVRSVRLPIATWKRLEAEAEAEAAAAKTSVNSLIAKRVG
jgi:hypothetical protein